MEAALLRERIVLLDGDPGVDLRGGQALGQRDDRRAAEGARTAREGSSGCEIARVDLRREFTPRPRPGRRRDDGHQLAALVKGTRSDAARPGPRARGVSEHVPSYRVGSDDVRFE